MARPEALNAIAPGTLLVVGGDRAIPVPDAVARAFRAGDALFAVEATGEVLHVPAAERRVADEAASRASAAFAHMGAVDDARISRFFAGFASRLENDTVWAAVARQNADDVAAARARGRSTTRLVADDTLRRGMIAGLRGWIEAPSRRGAVLETIAHEGWTLDLLGAELGVVGFVFEGRPNVVADATGVLRGGNTVVFRIGSDALGTARAIVREALEPALRDAGLPEGAVALVDSASHAAGWALFSDRRLALAVARGSGPAVATLGALARQAGIPASLHGTGGAWLVAGATADSAAFRDAVRCSLDRKVCNTLNVCCIPRRRAGELVPAFLEGAREAAAERGQPYRLHVVAGSQDVVPATLFQTTVTVRRAAGDVREPQADVVPADRLGEEWEWEETPEMTLAVVDGVDEAVALFNRHSPQFIASLVSGDTDEHARFYAAVNAPFVGNGFTRWVDGQYALRRPELGLSNWQHGRLLARGGVLSGDAVFTIRGRARQTDPRVRR
jgi:glutamate-5-semialdehyde dehydrogenase